MLSIFSCVFWPSVCLLWGNIYLDLLSIFDWIVYFFDIELHEVFVCFGDESLVGHLTCKNFLPFCGFSFCFVYSFFFCVKAFKFN